MSLSTLLLLLGLCITFAANNLFGADHCRKSSYTCLNEPARVGKDCLGALLKMSSFNSSYPLKDMRKFDPSAWDCIKEDKSLLAKSPRNIWRYFVKNFPQYCSSFSKADLLRFTDVAISKECADRLNSLIVSSLTLQELSSLTEKSTWFFTRLSHRLDPFVVVMKEIYTNYLNGKFPQNFSSSNFSDYKTNSTLPNMLKDLVAILSRSHSPSYADLFKFTCMVVGDALILDKEIYAFGQSFSLEGAHSDEIIIFLKTLLRELNSSDGYIERSTLTSILNHFESMYFLSILVKCLYLKNDDLLRLISAKFIWSLVKELNPHQSLIIPHGVSGSGAHATVAEFIKSSDNSSIFFNYYNTGGGIDYHPIHVNPLNSLEVKRSHKLSFEIPVNEFNEQFWNMFLLYLGQRKFPEDWNMDHVYRTFLGMIPPEYHVKNFTEKDIFIKGQLAGTCAIKSILTWMRTKFSSDDEYQYFKLALKSKAFLNATKSTSLHVKNQRRGLEMFIHLAEEVERAAEIVTRIYKFSHIAMEIGKKVNAEKRELFEHFSSNRNNPSASFSTLRIEKKANLQKILFFDNALNMGRKYFSFTERESDTSIEFSSFADDVSRLLFLIKEEYKGLNFLNFILEVASRWNRTSGEARPSNPFSLNELINDLDQLYKQVTNSPIPANSHELLLFKRLIAIQLWFALEDLEPGIKKFRPKFPRISINCMANPKYLKIMEETNKFSDGHVELDFSVHLPLIGQFPNSLAKNMIEFTDLFFNESQYAHYCSERTEKMKQKGYIDSPLILCRQCGYLLKILNSADQFYIILAAQIRAQELELKGSFKDQLYDEFSLNVEKKDKDVKIVPSFKARLSYNINKIMGGGSSSDLKTKIFKLANIMLLLEDDTKQFMLMGFLARRPAYFRRIHFIDIFYQALYPQYAIDSWSKNPNLPRSWISNLNFIFKYHSLQYEALNSDVALKALQNSIIFALNLGNCQNAALAMKSEFIDGIKGSIEVYRDLCKGKDLKSMQLIDPLYFYSIAAYLKEDFVDFASNYLAASTDLNFIDDQVEMLRVFKNLFGVALRSFYASATLDAMKIVASKTSVLTGGLCSGCGSFEKLTGRFPKFKDPSGCIIDLMDRLFLPDMSCLAFQSSYVRGLNEFCEYGKFFSSMGADLKQTIGKGNYEFIKTSRAEYRLARVIGDEKFVLIDYARVYFNMPFSNKLYSLWCSNEMCILLRYEKETLKTELIFQHSSSFITLEDRKCEYYRGDSVIPNYFPTSWIMSYECDHGKLREYHVLNYLDESGKQLRLLEENKIIYVGVERKYSASVEDLLTRKYPIYRLDIMGILVVDSNGRKYALMPHIDNRLPWYSSHAVWLGKLDKDRVESEVGQSIENFIQTSMILIDKNGYLKPSSRLQVILVAYYYLIAGEYEIAMNYLKGIHHTSSFSKQEFSMMKEITELPDKFPDALSVRCYGMWLAYNNNQLFSEQQADFPDIFTDSLLSLFSSYFSVQDHVSKNMSFFHTNSNPHCSILSKSETENFEIILKAVYNPIRENLYSSFISSAPVYEEIIDLDDISLLLNKISLPFIGCDSYSKEIVRVLVEKKDKIHEFCPYFKFLFSKTSLHLRRILHEACFSSVVNTNEISHSSLNYSFDPWYNLAHARVKYPKAPEISVDGKSLVNIFERQTLSSFESNLLSAYDQKIVQFFDDFNTILLAKENEDIVDCSAKTSYVDKNICEGEADLKKKQKFREALKDFILAPAFESSKNALESTIDVMKEDMKTILTELKNDCSVFNGEASNLVDFSHSCAFLDGFLMRFLRNAHKYLFERYFPMVPPAIVQAKITKYFALHAQIQRFERIIELSNAALAGSDSEAKLLEKADDLIVELSLRPAKEPFKFEILLFEKSTNFRLRNANLEALDELMRKKINGKPANSVVQRVMGGGKTLVLGTLGVTFAETDEFAILVVPIALLETNAGNTLSTNLLSFGQRGHVLSVSRCYPSDNDDFSHCLKLYSYILSTMQTCIDRKEFIITSRESLMSLYNSYKESLIQNIATIKNSLSRIIRVLQNHSFAIFDEVDSIMSPHFELNYPITPTQQIDIKLARSIISSFKILCRNDEIKRIFDIRKRHSASMQPKRFARILKILKQELEKDPHYLECIAEVGDEISCNSQIERFLRSTLFDCLSSRLNVSYGKMKEAHDLEALTDLSAIIHARPYEGANRESKSSEFSDPVTALVYTLLTYIRKGLSSAQKVHFVSSILKDSEAELAASLVATIRDSVVNNANVERGPDQTSLGKLFSSYCKFPNALSHFSKLDLMEKKDFLKRFCFLRKKSLGHVFSYIEKFVVPTITKTDQQVSSNAQDLFYMIKRFVAYSGTIDNKNVFDTKDFIKPDDIALGTIMSQVVTKNTKVLLIKSAPVMSEIFGLLKEEEKKITRAFVDVAALFNEASNGRLVNESVKELGLKGGLYFKTGSDNLFFTDGLHDFEMKKTDSLYLHEATKLHPNERFTFYDEVHTRGVDIVQEQDSLALVTVGTSTTLSNLLQGILRMRKFFGNQRIVFVVSESHSKPMLKALGKPDGELEAVDILNFAYNVQKSNESNENQTILLQKMTSFINDKITSQAMSQGSSKHSKYLVTEHLYEIQMLSLSFEGKVQKYFDKIDAFLQEHNEHKVWLEALLVEWTDRVKSLDDDKKNMVKNVQKQTENQKLSLRISQTLNQFESENLNYDSPSFYNYYKSLRWDCKNSDLFDRIDSTSVTDLSRVLPVLVSASALNSQLDVPNNCPGNVYLTSNFVQVLQKVEPNVSFKLSGLAPLARRDQFIFFVAVIRADPDDEDFRLVMFEPEEIETWLSYWNQQKSDNILVFSSSGDIVYPHSYSGNLFEMFSRNVSGNVSFSWNTHHIVNTFLTASYALGMLETFSSFYLSKELGMFEKMAKSVVSLYMLNDLFFIDGEVKNASILKEVLMASDLLDKKIDVCYRHLNNPKAPADLNFGISVLEKNDADDSFFNSDNKNDSEFLDSDSGKSEQQCSELDILLEEIESTEEEEKGDAPDASLEVSVKPADEANPSTRLDDDAVSAGNSYIHIAVDAVKDVEEGETKSHEEKEPTKTYVEKSTSTETGKSADAKTESQNNPGSTKQVTAGDEKKTNSGSLNAESCLYFMAILTCLLIL